MGGRIAAVAGETRTAIKTMIRIKRAHLTFPSSGISAGRLPVGSVNRWIWSGVRAHLDARPQALQRFCEAFVATFDVARIKDFGRALSA